MEQRAQRYASKETSGHGRPSSRWRSGVRSEDEMERINVEDVKRELSLKNKGMKYPAWWMGNDAIEIENVRKQVVQDEP